VLPAASTHLIALLITTSVCT